MHSKRVALVTGCSQPGGLGAALCKELIDKGNTVIATGRDIERTVYLEKEGCVVLQLDIGDLESIKSAFKEVESRYGRLDILINNAAIATTAPLLDMDPAAFQKHFKVNVFGTLDAIQAFGPLLVKTAHAKPDGSGGALGITQRTSIINIGSVQAPIGYPWMGAYASSKAAVQTLSDTLRKEMSPLGVDVINVELGGVKTPQTTGTTPFAATISEHPSGYYAKYTSYTTKLQEVMKKSSDTGGHTPEQAARDIVAAALKPTAPLKIWPGGSGWVFKYIFGLLPVSAFEGVLKRDNLVNEIAEWVDNES